MNDLEFGGRFKGAIDCDVHNAVPGPKALYPYLDDYWLDLMSDAGHPSLETSYYPPNSPLAARPGARPASGVPGSDRDLLIAQAVDGPGLGRAILNCLYGTQVLFNGYWAAAMTSALNAWIAEEWLDHDPRFSASLVVTAEEPEAAVAEIEKWAGDRRFVQVLLLARSQATLGRKRYWPIYEAAERHARPVCIHAGGGRGNPPMPVGWQQYYAEEYLAVAQGFQAQLVSLVTEGVFTKFPGLKVVFAESGFTWLPSLMWRLDKNWKGLRREIPWIDRLPSEIIRCHLRITIQPLDAPTELRKLSETIDQIGSEDMLLFSTDYPHWQFDDEGPFPLNLNASTEEKLLRTNAEGIYRFHA